MVAPQQLGMCGIWYDPFGAGVPAHARGGPRLWSAGQLLCAPGLGIDARCQAADPAVLIADEPTSALDAGSRRQVLA